MISMLGSTKFTAGLNGNMLVDAQKLSAKIRVLPENVLLRP